MAVRSAISIANFSVKFTVVAIYFFLYVQANGLFVGSFIRNPTVCVDIPYNLKLCRDVGYNRMILPNLLNHESLDEVRHQASSFVPLLNKGCHKHLQQFLCSLFAPVCMPQNSAVNGPIPPCKSFCKSVERSCTPIMQQHSFDWPPILNCNKFSDNHPCVILETNETTIPPDTSDLCAPCRTALEADSLHDNYCANEFVLKIKIKRLKIKKSRGIREIVADRRKKNTIYKKGPLLKRDLRKLKLVVQGSRRCSCPTLDETSEISIRKNAYFLVMGRKSERKFLVTVIHHWGKKNRELKSANKNKFGSEDCPEFNNPSLS